MAKQLKAEKPKRESAFIAEIDFPNPSVAILANLFFCGIQLDNHFNVMAKEFGISRAQFFVLLAIHTDKRNGIPFCELSRKLQVSRANISGILFRLEKASLVVRHPDKHDRRVILAGLSSKARKMLDSLREHNNKNADCIMGCLTKTEQKTLGALLTKVRQSIQKAF